MKQHTSEGLGRNDKHPVSAPRRIFLPPKGRPRWMPVGDKPGWELLYLSWGLRWMGDHPIGMAMHDGWVYAVVVEGTPRLQLQDREVRTRPGTVLIMHPDCAYGWTDKPQRSSRILTWLWRTPPSHQVLQPEQGGHLEMHVSRGVLAKFKAINKECMEAVAMPDETAFWILRRARLEGDIALAAALKRHEPADSQSRAHLALQYIRQNPAELQPGKMLCEYLQVSPTTLRVLFRQYFNCSPQQYGLEVRMQRAAERLKSGRLSVKEVAAELGYRHANDFSRAYVRFFGKQARVSGLRSK